MTALSAPDRAKLAKVLALLGSDKQGERDAAALAAHRILLKAGMSWGDVLAAKPPEHREPLIGTWRQTCIELAKQPGSLRPWERGFVTDLPKFQRLSTKQRYVLQETRRVLGTERRAMSAAREKRLRNKIRKALLTDEGMTRFLDGLFGRENYTYDSQNDVWVTPDRDHRGSGRGLIVVQRGGDWRKVVIPTAALQ